MPSDIEDLEREWDSLRTITKFDGLIGSSRIGDVGDGSGASSLGSTQLMTGSFIEHITNNATTPVSLLVESLVQQLCTMIDSDPVRSGQLYTSICEQLHKMNLIDKTYAMGEFEVMRSQYQRALYQLVSVARGQDLPVTVQSVWPLTQPVGMDWSRYYREFDEVAYIAGGGFGKVYKARHKLDGIVYAVKKVTIKSITIGHVLNHLAEVKTLASLNHTNVVPYKAAWLEPLLTDPTVVTNGIADNEEDDDEEEEEESMSCTSTMDHASLRLATVNEESSEFIQFEHSAASRMEASRQSSACAAVCKFTSSSVAQPAPSVALVAAAESQPHLNLKWATLFIQMSLCQLTLREWLDQRNQQDSFELFYSKFLMDMAVPQSPTDATNVTDPMFCHQSRIPTDDFDQVAQGSTIDAIALRTRNSVAIATDIFTQLVYGLGYIHARGIIHHDVKPSNVFVGVEANGELVVQLGDFGLACPLQDEHSANVIGTPAYAAPEQLRGFCDPKSDIFSLGVILIELLMPFKTDMERIRTIEAARRNQFPDTLPLAHRNLLQQLLQQQPRRRPTTAHIIETLKQMRRSSTTTVAVQRQLDDLTGELERLKHTIEKHESIEDELHTRESQLHSKDEELRSKDKTIAALQRQIDEMSTRSEEIRCKDEEISKLKEMLRQNSKETAKLT